MRIEDKIEITKINQYTDLWDDILLPLLELDHITENEANEAMDNPYYTKLLQFAKIEQECYIDHTILFTAKKEKDEVESWYYRNVL